MGPISYIKSHIHSLLRRTEKYTKADMVYLMASNFWLTIPRFALLFAGMGLTVAFANLLPPHIFGTYKYVLAAAGLVAAFSLNGMGASVLRSVAKGDPHVVPKLVRMTMLWSLPASIVALAVGAYYFAQENQTLGFAFLFIAIANVLTNGYGLAKSIMVATGDFKANALAGFPRALLSIAIVLATVVLTKNIVWILLAYFGSNVLLSWSLYRYSIRHQKIHENKTTAESVGEAVALGKHLSVLSFLLLLSSQLDQILLWHFADPVILATYAIALTPAREARNVLSNLVTVAFPRLAKKTQNDIDVGLPLRLRQMTLASVVIFLLYIVSIPLLFKLLFPQYLDSILIAQVLGLLILTQPLAIFDSLLLIRGDIKRRYLVVVSSQVFDLILLCTLIPLFGLWGAVVAVILSDAISSLSFFLAYKIRPTSVPQLP